MNKERFTVTASSLGSYFGCGFNDPMTQLFIDLGQMEVEPNQDSIDAMELGVFMEDATLNVLEKRLEIAIINRNVEVIDALDGKLRVKLDGETVYNGEPTIVETKYSNSDSGVFTKNKGYEFQCQAYMLAKDYNQAILGGMYKGRPIWRVIKRDGEIISDIVKMVDSVYNILNGIDTIDSFPMHLTDKYSSTIKPDKMDEFDNTDLPVVDRLIELNAILKELETEKESIQTAMKNKYEAVDYTDEDYKVVVSSYTRDGSFDDVGFTMVHPEIDLSKFRTKPTIVKTIRCRNIKKKVA